MKKFSLLFLALFAMMPMVSHASEEAHYPQEKWSFDGPFGTYDRASLQRGFQVYKQVCSACHSMKYLSYRNLVDIGLTELQVKALAADVSVQDGPNDDGEMFERPGLPSDHFKSPFANEKAARASNNGALPSDLSLIIKARHDGANYVHALLNGYVKPPEGTKVNPGQYYNEYFAGHQIGMPQPLTTEGQVAFADGTKPTVDQMSRDVVNFLTWAAEPKMEDRKAMGVKVMIFLAIFAAIMYAVKKKLWRKLKEENEE